jgi:hypothetical protein
MNLFQLRLSLLHELILLRINKDFIVINIYSGFKINCLFLEIVKNRSFNKIFSRFSRSHRQSIKQKQKKIVEIHESYRSHRPYFTYWVTFVQILVCIVSLIVYGYAPLSSNQSVIIQHNFFNDKKYVF